MCYLIQKHVFIYLLNNQKLLIWFNQFDVIVGKSLVNHSFEEESNKILRGKQRDKIHPLIQTCKGPNILLELENVRSIGS